MATPIPGTNSWVTITEANEYFEDKYNASAIWMALTNTQKGQLLITAFRWLMQQADYSLSKTDTSENIKAAQCEAAWFIYNFNDEMEKRRALYAQGVRNFRISEFSESLEEQQLPVNIAGLLEDYLSGLGGSLVTIDREEESNTGYESFQ